MLAGHSSSLVGSDQSRWDCSPRSTQNIFSKLLFNGHVKAAVAFNYNVARKYPDLYQPITSGEKIKFVYLVKQNPYQFESMAFIDKPPKEIELARYVDWPRQFQVTFLNPLETLAEAVKWKLVEESSLDDFFS